MRKLEALKAPDAFSELEKDFPRGACFRHVVGAMVRQIVFVLSDRLFDIGSTIHLSIIPTSDRNEKDGTPRLPVALIVRDGEHRHTIELATMETSVMICGKLLMTCRDDAVPRVAQAIVAAIESVLEPNEASEA